jgi:long-chain acyl-CoA synthetase
MRQDCGRSIADVRPKEAVVREYFEPALPASRSWNNITDAVVSNAQTHPQRLVISKKVGETYEDFTTIQLLAEITRVAKGLIASGVNPGDRVAIMSRTRYEWTITDYACWFAGAVPVPVYETSSAEQLEWILSDSGAVGIFLESDRHRAVFHQVAGKVPAVKHDWVFDNDDLTTLAAAGSSVTDEQVESARTSRSITDLATIIYTSGTTGRPKGCMLTHGNLAVEVDAVVDGLPELFKTEDAATLLFLPVAHVFGRAIQVGAVTARVRLGHCPDPKELLIELQGFKPTFILAVPRLFEKVFNGAQQKATAEGKGKIFDAAAATAIAHSEALDSGRPGLMLNLKHGLFDKLVYSKLRAAMGGNVRAAISGGAPLGARLGHFFRGIGVTIMEGYGLTETSAGSTINRPAKVKIGTVGAPIPGSGVQIADDGEVLLKGGHVFAGYYNNEAATAEAFTADGWFRSGDIGELDSDGYLKITGRKKEIIVTAGGKNVAPAVLEDKINSAFIVGQCMVVGDAKPYIAALITLDHEAFPLWAKNNGLPEDARVADHVNHPAIQAEIQKVVDAANESVSRAEQIKKFAVLSAEWTDQSGHATPSLKLKRGTILKDFQNEVDALYA